MSVKTPAECFQLFFSDTVIEFIVFKTKLYRKQNFDNDSNWQDISVAKMKAFFGIGLSMGLVDLSKFHDYWAGNNHDLLIYYISTMVLLHIAKKKIL